MIQASARRVSRALILLGVVAVALVPQRSEAQRTPPSASGNEGTDVLILRVEQVLRSLPPATSQIAAYTFEPELETFVPNELAGTSVLFSPTLVPPGELSIKSSASYFTLRPLRRSIDLSATVNQPARLTLKETAHVGALVFAASYGLNTWSEVDVQLPIVITHAHEAVAVSGEYLTVDELPQPPSPAAGLGRASVATKLRLLDQPEWSLALNAELLMPSPSQKELCGSDTGAFFPRLLLSYQAMAQLYGYANVGYDLDFVDGNLRSFVWQAGFSHARRELSVDLALSGALYQNGDVFAESDAFERQQLDTNLIDVVVGLQVPLTSQLSISGVATIPIVNVEFRPYAVGTLSATVTF